MRRGGITVIFWSLCLVWSHGVEIPNDVDSQIQFLIQQYSQPLVNSSIGIFDMPQPITTRVNNQTIILSAVFWCPKTRFGLCLKCPKHDKILGSSYWLCRNEHSPRLLYGLSQNSILIQRYYLCGGDQRNGKHRVLSTHPDIMDQLSKEQRRKCIFHLRHRSGWLNDLADYLMTEVSHGGTFQDIHEMLERLKREKLGHGLVFEKDNNIDNIETWNSILKQLFAQCTLLQTPCRDTIQTIFLETFERRKLMFEAHMDSLTASSISMDHTFKVSKNIGAMRSSDNAWVQQFSALFIVLNENGLVLTWAFTEKENFEEISPLLTSLRDRLCEKSIALSHACIDNCCKWAQLLGGVFGPGLEVKLDIFHALQRITRTISKAKRLTKECMDDLKSVVRARNDLFGNRKMHTPSPEIIEENINLFRKKWIDRITNDTPITDETEKELDKLLVHVRKGCLSNLPPGDGTNKNEYLHRLLNRSMLTGATKIGPELAYAVLTLLLFNHNLKRLGLSDIPSSSFVSNTSFVSEHSGESKQAVGRRFPKMKCGIADQNHLMNSRFDECIHNSLMNEIGLYCEMLFESVKSLHREVLKISYIRFAGSFERISQVSKLDINDKNEHTVRLHQVISKQKKMKVAMSENGDCAFLSLAYSLQSAVNVDSDNIEKYKQTLITQLNITAKLLSEPIEKLAHTLRLEFVNFLLKSENIEKFKPMTKFTTAGFIGEVGKFEEEGVFSGQIGDLVMPVMANLLGCPVILLTSIEDLPVLSIFPDVIENPNALFIAFNQFGPGHYDAVKDIEDEPPLNCIPKSEQVKSELLTPKSQAYCRCGVNESVDDKKVCVDGKRKTRCPCFREGVTCSNKCRCKNCENVGVSLVKRNREDSDGCEKPHYPRKRLCSNYKQQPSETFLKELGANISGGNCTLLERCLILSVANIIRLKDVTRSGKLNPSTIHSVYTRFVEGSNKELRPKSFRSISSLLRILLPETPNSDFVE